MTSMPTAAIPQLHTGEARAEGVSVWRTPRVRSLLALGVVGITGGLVALCAHVYTDLLWYRELGQERAFVTTLGWQVLARGLGGVGTACVVLASLAVATHVMRRRAPVATARNLVAVRRAWRPLITAVAAGCGALAGTSLDDRTWQVLLLWAHRSPFGVEDPLFGRDAGFYVFSLPLQQIVSGWLLGTLAMTVAATLGAYGLLGGRRALRWLVADRRPRSHLLVLASVALLLLAWRVRLDQLALVLADEHSEHPGASYTDVHVRVPLSSALALTGVAAAALCLLAIVRRVRLAAAVLVVVAGVLGVARGEAPGIVQRITVQPQELSRERDHVAQTIVFTRRAFGLDALRERRAPAERVLTAADVEANVRTLDNVPLWDPGVLRPALNDLQSIGRYFRFPSTTVARVRVGGEEQVMTLAARHLDVARLDRNERSWATLHFAYTHGYGVVATRAAAMDAERQPSFAQREFDLRANPLGVREPRIFYGERGSRGPPYLVLDTGRAEVDEPAPGSRAPDYHYPGGGGIPMSDPLRRVAFAVRFHDLKLLLTETVTRRSRMVLRRDARERVTTLAPFLHWDARPQTAVIAGRVHFLLHGYATSESHPYAARVRMGDEHVTYVREAAIAAVDAFDGRVTIYASPEPDPILRSWRAAYPGLFTDAARMPADMRAQLRYPRELFATQSRALETYHAEDATTLWNGSDAWGRPAQLAGPVEAVGEVRFPDPARQVDPDERRENGVTPSSWRMAPDYGLARLPGEQAEQFMLSMPFTPRGGQNLVAYLAGTRDARGRPRLTLLGLPRDRMAIGPTQATRRILANPGVDRRLQLLNRESRDLGRASVNRTVLGRPRVVPVAGTLVFVQPLYLLSAGGGLPALQLVTVVANGRVGYGETLRAAMLRAVRGPG